MLALSGGIVVVAAGVRTGGRGGSTAVIVGAALVAIVGALVPRRARVIVVPAALALGVRVGPSLSETSSARWLALMLGIAGAALALVPVMLRRSNVEWLMLRSRRFPLHIRPALCAAVAPWALAAAVGPLAGTTVAARALAAGAVLALLLGGQLALLAAVPGAAVFVYAVADGHGWPRAALAVLLLATIVGATWRRPLTEGARLAVADAVALVLTAWLVIRPTAWAWMRVGDLQAYREGALMALAAALIAGVLLTISGGRLELAAIAPGFVGGGDEDVPDAGGLWVVTLAIVVAMGLLAAALVRSARL
jgi:hypothetical protein